MGACPVTLSDLTDPMVRALLGNTKDADIIAATAVGLMKRRYSYDDEGDDCEMVTFTDAGHAVLSEAQRIAEGLTPAQLRVLVACEAYDRDGPFRERVDMPPALGKWRRRSERHYFSPTPAARLVLALRERQRSEVSS